MERRPESRNRRENYSELEFILNGKVNPDFFQRRLELAEREIPVLEEKLRILKEDATFCRTTLKEIYRSELNILMAI